MDIELISRNILNMLIGIEFPVNNFFSSFWLRIPDWGFILIATIIGAFVAVRVDKLFSTKKRINRAKLWAEVCRISFEAVAGLFLLVIVLGLFLITILAIIKTTMNYSSTITLIGVIILISILYFLDKKKKLQRYKPLKNWKERKIAGKKW